MSIKSVISRALIVAATTAPFAATAAHIDLKAGTGTEFYAYNVDANFDLTKAIYMRLGYEQYESWHSTPETKWLDFTAGLGYQKEIVAGYAATPRRARVEFTADINAVYASIDTGYDIKEFGGLAHIGVKTDFGFRKTYFEFDAEYTYLPEDRYGSLSIGAYYNLEQELDFGVVYEYSTETIFRPQQSIVFLNARWLF